MIRLLAAGAMLACFLIPAPSRVSAAEAEGPTLMLRIQSVDQLLNNGEYIAGLVGQEEQAKQLLGFVRILAGPKGIEGVDITKPFVLYADIASEIVNSKAVLMVPIADKESFLGLLKNRANLAVTEEKGGLYSTEAPNNMGTIFFRFANGYVYGTYLNKENVAVATLAKPDLVVGKGDSILDLTFRIDRLPEEMKKFALGTVENGLAQGKEAPLEIDTPAIKTLRNQTIDCIAASVKDVLYEGKSVSLKINADRKTDEISLALTLTAKDGTTLSRDIADLKSKKSIAFGIGGARETAIFLAINGSLPPSIKKVFGPAIDDVIKVGMEKAPIDAGAKEIIAPLLKAALPTLKSGDLDIGSVFLGPTAENKYTSVTIAKLVDGKSIEKAVKDAVAKLPADFQNMIELDADSVGTTKLHRVKVSSQLDDKTRKLLGDTDIWLAFRDDAALVALGAKAKESLAQALNSSPASGTVVKLEFSIGRLLPAVEVQDEQASKQAAKEVFGVNPTGDTFALNVEGGDRLTTRISLKGKVIKYLAAMDKYKDKAKKDK